MPNASDLSDLAEVNGQIIEQLAAGLELIGLETERAITSADRLIMLDTLKRTVANVAHYQKLAGWPKQRRYPD